MSHPSFPGAKSGVLLNALPQELQTIIYNSGGLQDTELQKSLKLENLLATNSATTADYALRRDDWVRISEDIIQVRQRSLIGLEDLRTAGVVSPVALNETLVELDNVNEFPEAETSMNGVSQQRNQSTFAPTFVPVPLYHSGWFIQNRQGLTYKTTQGNRAAARAVLEAQNSVIFNGAPNIVVRFNGENVPLYGYLNHPARQTGTISDWTNSANRDAIVDQSLALVGQLFENASVEGDNTVMMYVSDDFYMPLQQDYSAEKGDSTFIDRIERIRQINMVKPSSKLPPKTVCLVEMTEESVQYFEAAQVQTVPHLRVNPMDNQNFTTYAGGALFIKEDRKGGTGIVTATAS